MQVEVPDPNQLMNIFDTISYAKGSVICRMLHNYLGDESWKQSLRGYLTKHANANAKTPDLLTIMDEEFAKQSGSERFLHGSEQLTVSEFITPWISQKCFPMVMIEEDSEAVGAFTLTQSCVYMNMATREMLWPIHMTYRTSNGRTGSFVFSQREFEIVIELESEDEAVWFNADMLGFYLPIPSGPYFEDRLLPKV